MFLTCIRRYVRALATTAIIAVTPVRGDAQVPTPTVTGPLPSTTAGDPSRDYPFAAAAVDLKSSGWAEYEFFIEGSANRYDIQPLATAAVVDRGNAYKTRIVVRRPIAEARFNGTVVMEWLTVSAGRDVDDDWSQLYEHLIRSGYAWVGVTTQEAGVEALKAWNQKRYGTLSVTSGRTGARDILSYDVFAQAAQAVKNNAGQPRIMGGLRVERIFAMGHSQSAGRLGIYVNSVHPLHKVFEAVILHGGGARVREDLDIPVWKLLAETDVRPQAINRQPDTSKFRTWEVAGTSHADFKMMSYVNPLFARDGTPGAPANCEHPAYSRIPFHYVFSAAVDHLVLWVRDNTVPPAALPIDIRAVGPPAEIARDAAGNALGGIRLPQHAVPSAVNTGVNAGPIICPLSGTYEPFDAATLARLYPTHERYVQQVKDATNTSVKAGYILAIAAAEIIADAEKSTIGR